MEENPAAEPEHQPYSAENHQFEIQTPNPQMDSGDYPHRTYADENNDQYNNPVFYEQGNSQMYNTRPHNLQHQQSYNGSYDQGYVHHQNYHQSYNHDDY